MTVSSALLNCCSRNCSQRRRVHAWPIRQQRQQRLDLGCKGDPIRQSHIEQRLDAEAVAHKQQTPPRVVVEGEGVHAAQTFEKAVAVLGVAEQDRFRVRAGGGWAADAAQLVVQLDVVVDLAVGCQGQSAIAGDHRLVTSAQADDRKPRLRQPDRTSAVDAVIVRAAMGEGSRHGLEQGRLRPLSVFQHESSDAAHRDVPTR